MLKIRVMNISKKDLSKTLKKFKGTAWDQSPLFKKIYEEEYGQFGGEPYGCLVGDYHFDHSPPDVELLGEIAQIAAAGTPRSSPVPIPASCRWTRGRSSATRAT
jgi:type VI secretion system protein ImpC